MQLSLRTWLLVTCFLPAWLLILLGGGWLLLSYFDSKEQQLVDRGQLTLTHLAPSLAMKMADMEHLPQIRQLSEQLLEASDVRAFSLYDHQRSSLLHAGPSMRPLIDNSELRWSQVGQLAVESDTLRFIEPIYELPGGRDLGRFRPGYSPLLLGWAELELARTPTLLHKYRVLFFSGVLLLALMSLSFMLAHYLARYLSKRMDEQASFTRYLALGERPEIAINSSVTELAALNLSLANLSSQIGLREDSLQQAIDEVREDASRNLETIEIKNIELDRARKDALESSRIKSEFLANMSHEIRTPLNGIIGFSNLLSRTQMDSRQKEYLGHILGASETMLGIINDILDFSKIEAGKLVLEDEPVDVRELLDACLSLLAPQAHRQQLELIGLVYDDVPRLVKSDPLRLRQLLTNLLSNALKFTKQGEVVVRIMLDEEEVAEEELKTGKLHLRFAVSDTGIGLNPVQRKKLFRAFSQANTSQTHQFGGTGLGLAICKQLVQQMGGQIDLQSEEHKGSVFWFTLPLTVLEEASEPLPWLRGRELAILESHQLTARAWAHQLKTWGAQVDVFHSPEPLLTQLNQKPYAALVVGMSRQQASSPLWLDALGQIQNQAPSLLLLNTSEPEIYNRLKWRVSEYLLLKPLSVPRFKKALEQLLEISTNEAKALPATEGWVPELGNKIKILAVDDTPSNLLLLTTLLGQLGFEVVQAVSGEEAVAKVQQEAISLVFMDIQMPGMNGVEATHAIRALGHAYRSLPIVALTAHAVSEEKKHWLQSGLNDVLIKPLDEQRLMDLLHRWLGDRFIGGFANSEKDSEASTEAWQASPVDRDLGVRLAAGRPELADELLGLLLDSLDASKAAIAAAMEQQDDEQLLEAVHRLHGASRYCGVPYLAQLTEAMETQLKSRQAALVQTSAAQLFNEIDRLQEWQQQEYRPDWHTRANQTS